MSKVRKAFRKLGKKWFIDVIEEMNVRNTTGDTGTNFQFDVIFSLCFLQLEKVKNIFDYI